MIYLKVQYALKYVTHGLSELFKFATENSKHGYSSRLKTGSEKNYYAKRKLYVL